MAGDIIFMDALLIHCGLSYLEDMVRMHIFLEFPEWVQYRHEKLETIVNPITEEDEKSSYLQDNTSKAFKRVSAARKSKSVANGNKTVVYMSLARMRANKKEFRQL